MKRTWKLVLPIVAGLLLSTNISRPAHAQFAGGGGGGGFEQMQQMAPMLNMMKKKMGKKRFAKMMQTMGPMMSNMMDGQGGGGFGGMAGGFGGMGGGFGGGGFNMSSMSGMMNPEMIGGMMEMFGSGHGKGRLTKKFLRPAELPLPCANFHRVKVYVSWELLSSRFEPQLMACSKLRLP